MRRQETEIATYDSLADQYDARSQEFVEKDLFLIGPMSSYIRNRFDTTELKAIDLGCGVGLNCRMLEEDGIQTLGIDFSKKMITRAKKNSPQSVFWLGSFEDFESRQSFHGIFAKAFFHLFDDLSAKRHLEKCYDLLFDGGLIFVSVAEGEQSELMPKAKDDYAGKPLRLRREWNQKDLFRLIENVGFKPLYWDIHADDKRGKRWLQIWAQKCA